MLLCAQAIYPVIALDISIRNFSAVICTESQAGHSCEDGRIQSLQGFTIIIESPFLHVIVQLYVFSPSFFNTVCLSVDHPKKGMDKVRPGKPREFLKVSLANLMQIHF